MIFLYLSRKALFEYGQPKNRGKAFGKKPDRGRFAEMAIKKLATKVPHAILNGLVRVDLMQLADGRIVVNEFESLEANYGSTGDAAKKDMQLFRKLINYYTVLLNEFL
jgi:hypothetical protein